MAGHQLHVRQVGHVPGTHNQAAAVRICFYLFDNIRYLVNGVTIGAASLCGLPYVHQDFDLPIANVRHADCPHYWRLGKSGETEEQFAPCMAESLEAMIQREGPDTVAAFIAEPVQGVGGVVIPPLIITSAEIDDMFDRLACAIDETTKMVAMLS